MNYQEAIEIFDTLNEDDKAKEIYAYFGLAIFFSQLLEQQSINMIAICKQSTNNLTKAQDIFTLWNNYDLGSRSFGVLINEIKQNYQLSQKDIAELKALLKLRNYITHDYFRLNSELMHSDSGMKRMIKDFIDFIDFRQRAKSLDQKLEKHMWLYAEKLGLKPEKIDNILEKHKIEWKKKQISTDYNTFHK